MILKLAEVVGIDGRPLHAYVPNVRAEQLKGTSFESAKPGEIPVLSYQDGHARFAADSNDLRVEDKIADSIGLSNRLFEQGNVSRPGNENPKTRRLQNAIDSVAGFIARVGGIEELRVRDDANEFTPMLRNSARCA